MINNGLTQESMSPHWYKQINRREGKAHFFSSEEKPNQHKRKDDIRKPPLTIIIITTDSEKNH